MENIKSDTFDYSIYPELLSKTFVMNGLEQSATSQITQKLTVFCEFLLDQNKLFNLTAIKTPEAAALLHFADSLTVSRFIPENATVLDVGSGAGFPAVPLAVARPDITILALDSTAKRVNFIYAAKEKLGLDNLTVLCSRAEDLTGKDLRGYFDIVTARAVSAFPTLFELCIPAVKIGGSFIAMKSASAAAEIRGFNRIAKQFSVSDPQIHKILLTSGDDVYERNIVCVQKHGETPQKYPRAYAKIKSKPLF